MSLVCRRETTHGHLPVVVSWPRSHGSFLTSSFMKLFSLIPQWVKASTLSNCNARYIYRDITVETQIRACLTRTWTIMSISGTNEIILVKTTKKWNPNMFSYCLFGQKKTKKSRSTCFAYLWFKAVASLFIPELKKQ